MISKSKLGTTIADWLINIKSGYGNTTLIGPFKLIRTSNTSIITVHYISGHSDSYSLYRFKDKIVPVETILVGQYEIGNPEFLDKLYDDMSRFPSERLDINYTAVTKNTYIAEQSDDDFGWATDTALDLHYITIGKVAETFKKEPKYVNFKAKVGDFLYLLTIRYSSSDSFGTGSGKFVFVEIYKTREEADDVASKLEKFYSRFRNRYEAKTEAEIMEYDNAIKMADPTNSYNSASPNLTMWGESFLGTQVDALEVIDE